MPSSVRVSEHYDHAWVSAKPCNNLGLAHGVTDDGPFAEDPLRDGQPVFVQGAAYTHRGSPVWKKQE